MQLSTLSLKEKAVLMDRLLHEPGWDLLKQSFNPEIRSQITDTNTREAFLYEAIRAQVIQEIFNAPIQLIQRVDRGYALRLGRALNGPVPPIVFEESERLDSDVAS